MGAADLFEEKYFRTNIGGDQYFSIAKELRPEDVELAAIVFTGLALGFRGKYRERPEKAVEIKNRVYRLLAEYLADVGDKITPEAYHVTAAPARKLSPAVTLARVAIVGVGILFLYYAITWLMWAALGRRPADRRAGDGADVAPCRNSSLFSRGFRGRSSTSAPPSSSFPSATSSSASSGSRSTGGSSSLGLLVIVAAVVLFEFLRKGREKQKGRAFEGELRKDSQSGGERRRKRCARR